MEDENGSLGGSGSGESGSSGSPGGGSQWGTSTPVVWVAGEAMESLSPAQARNEISEIQNHPYFFDKDNKAPYWERQKMLKRLTELYATAGSDDPDMPKDVEEIGMYQTLKKAGVTREGLKDQQEDFKDRDSKAIMDKALDELAVRLGGDKEQAQKHVEIADRLYSQYATKRDKEFVRASGLANNSEFIYHLGQVFKLLQSKQEQEDFGGRRKR